MLLKIHQKQWGTGTTNDAREKRNFTDPWTLKNLVTLLGDQLKLKSAVKLWMIDKDELP